MLAYVQRKSAHLHHELLWPGNDFEVSGQMSPGVQGNLYPKLRTTRISPTIFGRESSSRAKANRNKNERHRQAKVGRATPLRSKSWRSKRPRCPPPPPVPGLCYEVLTLCIAVIFGVAHRICKLLLPHLHHPDPEIGDPEIVPGDGRFQFIQHVPELQVRDAGRPDDITGPGGAPDRQRREQN